MRGETSSSRVQQSNSLFTLHLYGPLWLWVKDVGRICTGLLPQWAMPDSSEEKQWVRGTRPGCWGGALWWHHRDAVSLIARERQWCLQLDLYHAAPPAPFGSRLPSAWCPPCSNPPICQSSRLAGGESLWKSAFLVGGWGSPPVEFDCDQFVCAHVRTFWPQLILPLRTERSSARFSGLEQSRVFLWFGASSSLFALSIETTSTSFRVSSSSWWTHLNAPMAGLCHISIFITKLSYTYAVTIVC